MLFGLWKKAVGHHMRNSCHFLILGIKEVSPGEQHADRCCRLWTTSTNCNCLFIQVSIIFIYGSFCHLALGSKILQEVCKPCKISAKSLLPVPKDRHLPVCPDFEEVLASMSIVISKIFYWRNYGDVPICSCYPGIITFAETDLVNPTARHKTLDAKGTLYTQLFCVCQKGQSYTGSSHYFLHLPRQR